MRVQCDPKRIEDLEAGSCDEVARDCVKNCDTVRLCGVAILRYLAIVNSLAPPHLPLPQIPPVQPARQPPLHRAAGLTLKTLRTSERPSSARRWCELEEGPKAGPNLAAAHPHGEQLAEALTIGSERPQPPALILEGGQKRGAALCSLYSASSTCSASVA